jgi:hypothetical protein
VPLRVIQRDNARITPQVPRRTEAELPATVRLSIIFSFGWFELSSQQKFVRLEVKPGTQTHANLWAGHFPRAARRLPFPA